MPDLLILRLLPAKPISPAAFTQLITGLEITVFDLSLTTIPPEPPETGTTVGHEIGKVSKVVSTPNVGLSPNPATINFAALAFKKGAIVQHFTESPVGLPPQLDRELDSAATAVVVVDLPIANYPEYPGRPSYDIRLVLKRGGRTVNLKTVEFNVTAVSVGALSGLSNQQSAYFDTDPAGPFPTSAYVTLPAAIADPATVAGTELPEDGVPPPFEDLRAEIDKVLKMDPGAGATLASSSPLSLNKSRQVAAEIVWNRTLDPMPEPTRGLNELYTLPTSGTLNSDVDNDRKKFEAELARYRATHAGDALRLTGYVFSASAAIASEALTADRRSAILDFAVVAGQPPSTGIVSASLRLENAGNPFNPSYVIPAQFFYALGADLPPQIDAGRRVEMATVETERRLLDQFAFAIEGGWITDTASPIGGPPAPPAINEKQAARRLRALRPDVSAMATIEQATIPSLDKAWLDYAGGTADLGVFWAAEESGADKAEYLTVLLWAITAGLKPLVDGIVARFALTRANLLAPIKDADWRAFLLQNSALLPEFTKPGTTAERSAAFIRHLKQFFSVAFSAPGSPPVSGDGPPTLPVSIADLVGWFATGFETSSGTTFDFAKYPWPSGDVEAALGQMFDNTPEGIKARCWMQQALETVGELTALTKNVGSPDIRFSLMEALYARGFTSAADVAKLSAADFLEALTGTVAYHPYAGAIHANSEPSTAGSPSAPGPFTPVNPGGSLRNCIPPPNRSPLGLIEYLREMLLVTGAMTCAEPLCPDQAEGGVPTLGDLVLARRGPLGNLLSTRSNLETQLPIVDLVNESLERVVGTLPTVGGAVHDTPWQSLGDHALRPVGTTAPALGTTPYQHDPDVLFGVMPGHSSPVTPGEPGSTAYATLRVDFSSPVLPYDQPLDVNRSYFRAMGTTRYAAMRRFRKDITEFVIDPGKEPATFQRHLWRYPVRESVAREYLGISPDIDHLLFRTPPDGVGLPPAPPLVLHELYGFPNATVGGKPWTEIVVVVSEFLRRTGLAYCEFVELWRSAYVEFGLGEITGDVPDCEPCCLEDLTIAFGDPSDPKEALLRLAVFIRLWRLLRSVPNAAYTFAELRDICDVLGLFVGPAQNPDFVRQLAAFQILRDQLKLPLTDGEAAINPPGIGAARTKILALWATPPVAALAPPLTWAIGELLERLPAYAVGRHHSKPRPSEFVKLLVENLDPLSVLAGFDPATAATAWQAHPTSTLRFVEVLGKVYASPFGIGELLFLFTAAPHLDGDDPFALASDNETCDDPLDLPDDEERFSLWELRRKLLKVEVGDDELAAWPWPRIEASLREEFGFGPAAANDPLLAIGEHMFPGVLEAAGHPVALAARRYSSDPVPSSGLMWNTPPLGPFRYDDAANVLWTELPLMDEAVLHKLSRVRPLRPDEAAAVRTLRAVPQVDLAAVDFLFPSFAEADRQIIQEADEAKRWAFFQRAFVTARTRGEVIAQHLAEHVDHATERDRPEPPEPPVAVARRILRSLHADENRAITDWEVDDGTPPPTHLWDGPNGRALPAILGLIGNGLMAEYRDSGEKLVWREPEGPLDAFGYARSSWNAPLPTVLPGIAYALPAGQDRYMGIRNGFGIANATAEALGGVEGFHVTWDGDLLVEAEGEHIFHAGAPKPDDGEPDREAASEGTWRVRLQRGERSWVLLARDWKGEDAPARESSPIYLRRGVYRLTVEYRRRAPDFDGPEDVRPQVAGFRLKYSGPDTGDRLIAVPIDRLFIPRKDATLAAAGLAGPAVGGLSPAETALLTRRFTSTLRDIRRTYQRAFKALLFARRHNLLADPVADDGESELSLMLRLADRFQGTSYFQQGAGYKDHHANFDFDLLPVLDNFLPPPVADDHRADPSVRRRQALFDWWERTYDYTVLRREAESAPERPVWVLFHEADEHHDDDPAHLLRHMDIDLRHDNLVQAYAVPPGPAFALTWQELVDERWAIRAWKADGWLRQVDARWLMLDIRDADPPHWVLDDPEPDGNTNLTRLVENGAFENGQPRRYEDVRLLNDGLRERARAALVAFLCGMDRVLLPGLAGQIARTPRDLSELLLQDVDAGICERSSRIEDAISSIQAFVQRARLGLEPSLVVSEEFALFWDRTYATFEAWQTCKRRELYRENWIEWDELEQARRVEAFRFLEEELRRSSLTVAVPGGMEWWPGARPPIHSSLEFLQAREPSGIRLLLQGPPPTGNELERLGLEGTPEHDARPSWLAPVTLEARSWTPPEKPMDDGDEHGDVGNHVTTAIALVEGPGGDQPRVATAVAGEGGGGGEGVTSSDNDRLPFWIQAAIRLGTRFVRVAAAGIPPASTGFSPREAPVTPGCCDDCGRSHPSTIDEYYFWLADARAFEAGDQEQDADVGTTEDDPTSGWESDDELPKLLDWPSQPIVHLHWSRVHNGEFQLPRRSTEGVRVKLDQPAGVLPQLGFMGRTGDSLRFEVSKGSMPAGHDNKPPAGFRYDIATDSAVVLPLLVPDTPPLLSVYPGLLPAYPFFMYFEPGAHVEPPSLFSVGMTVAGVLRAHCRFEAALKWYALVADPLTRDDSWARCAEPEEPPDDGPGDGPDGGPVGVDVLAEGGPPDGPAPGHDEATAAEIQPDPEVMGHSGTVCCPTAPVSDFVARDRAILLAWAETLLDWGGGLLCKNSPEAFRQATVIFETLQRVLGDVPATIVLEDVVGEAVPVSQFQPDEPPLNPRLLSLYDRSADRLLLVHACQNARRRRNGRPKIDMPYFGDAIWVDGWQTTTDVCADESAWCLTCCSPYRFSFLHQKASELANEVRGFGGLLLQAYEKGDAEHLAAIRATHERQLLELALQVRQHQWRDADWQVQALQKTKEGAQTRKRYYEGLIANGLNAGEIGYESLTGVSMASRTAGDVLEAIAQGMAMVPDMWIGVAGVGGTPLQYQQMPLGVKLGTGFATAARIMNALADIANSGAGLSMTEGGWTRREAEWRHLVEVTGIEIEMIERQKLGAERRRDAALRDLNDQQRQIEHSAELQDFIRDKFTSHELYLFLQRETAALHRQSYELALRAAREAQRAYNVERGYTADTFVPDDAWDDLHEGLLAGERLSFALRRMEKSYLDANCREYELTKHISLRLNFPEAFLRLQTTGECEIELPEWLFDLDYPGQYMRRIKNVSLTVPAVVGPYTGIHCRLTLLSSVTRIDPGLLPAPEGCCDGSMPANGYEPQPDDPRIVRLYAATEAIATSSGQNDAGLFELTFRDERYLPFEYGGAVSRWRIELPPDNNVFDFDSLSDIVLHLNYTAREGGDVLRAAANVLAQQHLPGAGVRFFSVRNELTDAWGRFLAGAAPGGVTRELDVRLSRQMFPFLQGRKPVAVRHLELLFEAPDTDPAVHYPVLFLGPDHAGHDRAELCRCRGWTVECVASSEWPGLFHGVVPDEAFEGIQPLDGQLALIGTARFRADLDVADAFLFCGYALAQPTRA